MNVSKLSSVSFKSTPIFDVKVKKRNLKGNWNSVDAVFSELSSYDDEDRKTIKKLEKKWGKTQFIYGISRGFSLHRDGHNASYYAIELKDKKLPPEKRILSLADVTNNKSEKIKYLNYLQTAPCISKKVLPKYKGAGEVMIYGIVKKAVPENLKSIDLESTTKAQSFYNHIGLTPIENEFERKFWQLESENFSQYMSRVEDKYNINQNQELKNNNE